MKKIGFLLRMALFVALCHAPLCRASAPVRVACVGNSVTYGWGVENREQNCYPVVLQRLLGEGYEVGNFGHCGATLLRKGNYPYVERPEYQQALDFHPDIVVIHLGLNDITPFNWPDHCFEFLGDYHTLIESFRAVNPHAKIYACLMTPVFHDHGWFKSGMREWRQQAQWFIRQLPVPLIDLEEALCDRPDLFPDALHPNAEGAELIARQVYRSITGDFGKLRMSPLFADHMVLRMHETEIKGLANPGHTVEVTLTEKRPRGRKTQDVVLFERTVQAQPDGEWSVVIHVPRAVKSATLTIQTPDTTAVYRNVGVGEVWMVSGQSNMSWPVAWSAAEDRAAVRPNADIRLFKANPSFANERGPLDVAELASINRLDYIRNPEGWIPASEGNRVIVDEFSAVGWFFAQSLADSVPDMPIGVIQTALGGAPTEAFVSRRTLEDNPEIRDILYNWRENPMVQEWVRGVAKANLEGSSNPLQRHFFDPAYLFESRIAPMAGYGIDGVLWYQGESNAHNTDLHAKLFPEMVCSFWDAFLNYRAPRFYYVQLSSIGDRLSWPDFRNTQRLLNLKEDGPYLSLPSVIDGMVVSSDVGDSLDVHPRQKGIIGERLMWMTRWNDEQKERYCPRVLETRVDRDRGEITLVFSGPLFLAQGTGDHPLTLEVAGPDFRFFPVEGRIEGDELVLSVEPDMTRVLWLYVRYGWQPYTRANLCGEGPYYMPVSTFLHDVPKRLYP